MGIQLVLVAALCATISNYFMRRSVDLGRSTSLFLVIQLFLSFLVAVLLNPVRTGDYVWCWSMAGFGFAGGLILGYLMLSLGKALEAGPPGLTFAIVNSASVMPQILMFLIFGAAYGYIFSINNGVGSVLVIIGLFWAGWRAKKIKNKRKWVIFSVAAFILQMLGLAWLQWRALFICFPKAHNLILSLNAHEAKNQWFLPMLFFAAFLVQVAAIVKKKKLKFKKPELLCGIFGGIANGATTFFLMISTEHALVWERPMMFPIFAVTIIILCNVWGQVLYRERVNWWANGVCVIGVFIGTLEMSSIR